MQISLEARIVGIADTFDALLRTRIRPDSENEKKALAKQELIHFFEKTKGRQFEDNLINIMLNNIDSFIEIRNNIISYSQESYTKKQGV